MILPLSQYKFFPSESPERVLVQYYYYIIKRICYWYFINCGICIRLVYSKRKCSACAGQDKSHKESVI